MGVGWGWGGGGVRVCACVCVRECTLKTDSIDDIMN